MNFKKKVRQLKNEFFNKINKLNLCSKSVWKFQNYSNFKSTQILEQF